MLRHRFRNRPSLIYLLSLEMPVPTGFAEKIGQRAGRRRDGKTRQGGGQTGREMDGATFWGESARRSTIIGPTRPGSDSKEGLGRRLSGLLRQ